MSSSRTSPIDRTPVWRDVSERQPDDPPENRPSVISAHFGPSPNAFRRLGRASPHPRPALGAPYRTTTTSPGSIRPPRIASTASPGPVTSPGHGTPTGSGRSRLHNAAVGGEAVLRTASPPSLCTRGCRGCSRLGVRVQGRPPVGRAERLHRPTPPAPRGTTERPDADPPRCPTRQPLPTESAWMAEPTVEKTAAAQLAEDRGHATGAVDVLHVVLVRGDTLQMLGVSETGGRCRPGEVDGPALRQMCSTVPVEPPIAMLPHRVLERGLAAIDSGRTDRRPRRSNVGQPDREVRPPNRPRAYAVASVEPLPGRDRPSARRAVHRVGGMPEHEPQVARVGPIIRLFVADLGIDGLDHGVDEVEPFDPPSSGAPEMRRPAGVRPPSGHRRRTPSGC